MQTIIDLKPIIAEYAVELYFSGVPVEEVIAKAKEKYRSELNEV